MPRYQRAPNGDYELLSEEEEPSYVVHAEPSASEEEPWLNRHAAVVLPTLLVGAYFLGRWWQKKKVTTPTSWTP